MTAQLSREDVIELRNSFKCWQQDYDSKYDAEQYEMFGRAITATDMLLSAMSSKPVAWLLSGGGAKNHVSFDSGNAYDDPLREVTPLYAAPLAPGAVPDEMDLLTCHLDGVTETYAEGWNACRAAMLKARPVTGWIKCSERMPGTGQQVLATNRKINVFEVAIFDTGSISGKEYFGTSSGKFVATHWMPLPAAPEQEV